ncbi:MAG: PEGA domain-containing protein, partial [Terriglobales bacterium]
FNVTGLAPGKHLISAIKAGYSSEIRSVDIASGSKTSVVFHLAPVNALVVVNSTPPGADITLDGKPTHKVTPAQFAVEKGTHTVVLKKQGFLDETTTADLGPGQNFQYAPALRALGDSEAIRTVGRFKKLFGSGGESTAGMGSVSIRTRPKGAQVVINQRILDKMSPVEVMMGPGNYVVDITLTGFKPVHKIIDVEKDGKVVIDETLERE